MIKKKEFNNIAIMLYNACFMWSGEYSTNKPDISKEENNSTRTSEKNRMSI